MESRPEEDPRRVGEARRRPRQAGAQRLEALALLLAERMVGLFGAGQMADHQHQIEGCERAGVEPLEVGPGKAQPAHAGVDLERCRQPATRRRACSA